MLVESGFVHVEHKQNVFRRLCEIARAFSKLDVHPDEVHIEQLVRNTHIYTHWSVAAIGIVFASRGIPVAADIPISSWQAYCKWRAGQAPLEAYQGRQEDERSAIGQGLWYVNQR